MWTPPQDNSFKADLCSMFFLQFGGKLVSFENTKPASPQAPIQHLVSISQVVTETDLVAKSNQLESALANGQFAEFCSLKIANSKNEQEENIWNFLKVSFNFFVDF